MKSLRRTGDRTSSRRGVLTFEWILLISLLVIGIIGGLSAVRNSLLSELNDLDQCIQQLNTSGTTQTVNGLGAAELAGAESPWWEASPAK